MFLAFFFFFFGIVVFAVLVFFLQMETREAGLKFLDLDSRPQHYAQTHGLARLI